MSEALHPLSLGEVLDRTAQLYRTRFLVYLGIALIPTGTVVVLFAVVFAIAAWAGAGGSDPSNQAIVGILVIGALGLLAVPAYVGTNALGFAALSDAAARAFLGEPISIRASYRNAWKRGWRYVWAYLLGAILVAGIPMLVLFGFAFGGGMLAALAQRAGLGSLSAVLGFLIFIAMAVLGVFAVIALLHICLVFPACVVEQISAWKAMLRSHTLSKGTKGRIFLLFLLGLALNWILVIGFSIPLILVMALVPGASNPSHAERAGQIFIFVFYGLGFAVQAFTKPVYGIALTLFYFDQRIRNEGFDLEWQMRAAGMVTDANLAPATIEAPDSTGLQTDPTDLEAPVSQTSETQPAVELTGQNQIAEAVAEPPAPETGSGTG